MLIDEFHPNEFVDALSGILPTGAPVALLDFPWHNNPGDAALWKGETLALAKLGHRIVYTSTHDTFDRHRLDRLLPTDGVVLLHGGGNLGDLWPRHQKFRESIISTVRDRSIVVLPQTVRFEDQRSEIDSLLLMASHPSLTMMARDQRSFDRLIAAGLNARLSTDPTTALWPNPSQPHEPQGRRQVLYLLRSDHERRVPVPLALKPLARDWSDLGVTMEIVSRPSHITDRSLDVIDRAQTEFGRALPATCWARIARQRRHSDRLVAAATAAILATDIVVTDRLHGMLFGLAFGRPVIAIESGYGKLSNYAETFLGGNRRLHLLHSFDEVASVLELIERP